MATRFHRPPSQRGRHFIKEWRIHRQLTQDQLAERIGTTAANLSRLENRLQDYNQSLLEALAEALSCEPADLIMRDPSQVEAPWSIWETLKPAQRKQAITIIKALKNSDEDESDRKAG